MSPVADNLRDVAPGLVHHLGNILFTLQGRAALLPEGKERTVLLDATQRAHAAVQLLRWQLGEGGEAPQPAGALVHQLVDLLRVGYREAGVHLLARVTTAARPTAPTPLVALLPMLCRTLCQGAVAGTALRFDCVDGAEGRIALQVDCEPPPGALPFRWNAADLSDCLADVLAPMAAELTVAADGRALRLEWRSAAILGAVLAQS